MPIFIAPKPPELKPLTVNLTTCARCGGFHAAMQFSKLTRPMATPAGDTLTHWALCPVNGEPVLLKVDEGKEGK